MGGKLSTSEQQEHWEPAILEVDVLAEQEPRQAEIQPDATDWHGLPALHRVVEVGDDAKVQRLLAVGTSVHATDDAGRTPLIVAASKGNARLCGLLIDAGSDVGTRDRLGRTALHAAAVVECGPPVVEMLLQRGADPHTQDSCGRTALHCALQTGNRATAEVLVTAVGPLLKWDVTDRMGLQLEKQLIAGTSGGGAVRDDVDEKMLARVRQARKWQMAGILAAKASLCQPSDLSGRTALHWAAYAGYSTVVHQLLERGFSPLAKDLCGRDALMWAVESGVTTVVEQIVHKYGYCMCIDKKGQTALHVAAIRGDEAVTRLLLDHRADAGRVDLKWRTPLMYALRGAHRGAARMLATHGPVTWHGRDRRGLTLLHWAAMGGDVFAVRQLLAHGADVNALDTENKSPAALAVEHRHQDVAALLVEADGFRVTRDREGRTALHGAAAAGWGQVALKLVSLGADPHEEDKEMVSSVQMATRAGRYTLAWDISRAGWR